MLWQLESVPENNLRYRFRNVSTNLYLGCNKRDNKKPFTRETRPTWKSAWGIVELKADHLPGDAVTGFIINTLLITAALTGGVAIIAASAGVGAAGVAATIATAAAGAGAMGTGVAGFLQMQGNGIAGNVASAVFGDTFALLIGRRTE
jgi:hypothetical protein